MVCEVNSVNGSFPEVVRDIVLERALAWSKTNPGNSNGKREREHTWEVKIEGAKHISATEGIAVKEVGGRLGRISSRHEWSLIFSWGRWRTELGRRKKEKKRPPSGFHFLTQCGSPTWGVDQSERGRYRLGGVEPTEVFVCVCLPMSTAGV